MTLGWGTRALAHSPMNMHRGGWSRCSGSRGCSLGNSLCPLACNLAPQLARQLPEHLRSRGPNTCVRGATMEGPLHRQAATLRAKYFKGRYRVAPGHIGFHPSNRGGQAPNGERCVTLLLTILRDGYDPQEGDHAGILVQEVPGRRTVQAFNDAALHGDPLLTPIDRGRCSAIREFESQSLEPGVQTHLGATSSGRACSR